MKKTKTYVFVYYRVTLASGRIFEGNVRVVDKDFGTAYERAEKSIESMELVKKNNGRYVITNVQEFKS